MRASPSPSAPNPSARPLADQARALLPILRQQARRPYIVELAGTPKAGKTTALHIVGRFFKECGYQVHPMRERASDCPIAMKGHFFFNTWTTTTMIASMIETLDTEADLVLLDRGVFDSIVWLEAQSHEHQVTAQEREVFRSFALLPRWRERTDLTFVLRVCPQEAMRRENKDLLIPRRGSIVSAGYLERYNSVLGQVQASVADQFSFVDIDTTEHGTPKKTNEAIATTLLEHMGRWTDPEIAAIPRAVVTELFARSPVRALPEIIEPVQRALVIRRRSTLESDDAFVQLVSAVVLRHEGNMLLFRRKGGRDEAKIKTFGQDLLWKGCHVPCSPGVPGPLPSTSGAAVDVLRACAEAIKARLREDFHLAHLESEPIPRVMIWNEPPAEARHLGVFFDLEIPAPRVAQALTGKVFKRQRDRSKLQANQFVSTAALYERMRHGEDIELESWSQQLLLHMMHGAPSGTGPRSPGTATSP
ncbi:MAG: hypothetical protein AAGF11_12060 [Myxococcota bacterium]